MALTALAVIFLFSLLSILIEDSAAQSEPCSYNTTSCIATNITTCLGAKVTFSHTSLLFANDSSTPEDVETSLAQWSLLQRVPECWAVIQPFLCSVYLPKCDATEQKVELPNKELCERTREPCRVVKQFNGDWPEFLKCDAWYFSSGCGLTYFEHSDFNTTGTCAAPLIRTTEETSWYEDIKGCGIQCQNPLFTEGEHNAVHIVIAIAGTLCIISTLFTLLTFIIDWKTGRRYPAVILFFICGCFFLGSCGWMVQFVGDVRQDIICRADGTVRKGEPDIGSGESATCTIVFLLVYFFMMSGVVWFVMLAYSWDVTFKALGTVRDDLTKKTAYFHIISWCLPLVLTIVCLTISEVDGDSLSGICFVGYFNNTARAGFVLAPIGVVLIVGMIFLIRGLCTLIRVKKDSPQVISDRATAKIRGTIFRLGIFTGLAFTFVLVTFIVHLYTFTSESRWAASFKDYILCQANVSLALIKNNETIPSCEIEDRPSLAAAVVHILGFFGVGIAMSSWSWTEASLDAWKRLFGRCCDKTEKKNPEEIREKRLMAKAFKKKLRKEIKKGRLSFTYGNDKDDPKGMKFDMNSVSSQSLSSGYAIAMKKMARRHARAMARKGQLRKSSESDLSSTASRVSKPDSRRGSQESNQSRRISDIEREIRHLERMKRRKKRRKKRHINRVQPVLEPISSAMAAMQENQNGKVRRTHSHNSNTSMRSKASTNAVNVDLEKMKMENNYSASSNILSDSVTTNSSASEIPLPQNLTDFSLFNVGQNKGDNMELTTTLKGAKSSPSGSFRRGRKREYKLEMTETSFYQEDDENIEMSGNRIIRAQDKTHETAEMRNVMSEMNEFMENVRAASGNGRYSSERRNSGQRDPFGSGRMGSASSRGSQTHGKEIVPHGLPVPNRGTVPDKIEAPGLDYGKRQGAKHWAGDYLVSGDTGLVDTISRQGSASGHKRQIGNNGRIDRSIVFEFHGKDGELNKSRLNPAIHDVTNANDVELEWSKIEHAGDRAGSGGSREGSGKQREGSGNSNKSWSRYVGKQDHAVNILDVAEEHGRLKSKPLGNNVDVLDISAEHRHKLKPEMYSRHRLKPKIDMLNVAAEHRRLKPSANVDILDVEAEHRLLTANNDVDVLNVEAEHQQLDQRFVYDPYSKLNQQYNYIPTLVNHQNEISQKPQNDLQLVKKPDVNPNPNITYTQLKERNPFSYTKPHLDTGQPNEPSKSEERRRNLKRKHGRQGSAGSRGSSRTSSRTSSSRASSGTSARSFRSEHSQADSESSMQAGPANLQTGFAGNIQTGPVIMSKQTGPAGIPTGSSGNKQTGSSDKNREKSGGSRQSGSASSKQTSSAGSKSSRTLQYDGIKVANETSAKNKYDKFLTEKFLASTILPGVEVNEKLLDLIDYDDDGTSSSSEDDDDDIDTDLIYDEALLETTSYDDDLTEVSSLPC